MNFDQFKRVVKNGDQAIFTDFSVFLDKLSLMTIAKKGHFFPDCFQLPSSEDINLIESSYDCLIPFIVESTGGQRDIYCYDFKQKSCPKVAVFADHSIVNRWDSVPEFLSWFSNIAKAER